MNKKININILINSNFFIGCVMILSAIVFIAILLFLNIDFLEKKAFLLIIGTLITSGSGILYYKCSCKKNERI